MNVMLKHRLPGTMLSATLLIATGCDNPSPALIEYEQRGACNGFVHSGGMTNAGPHRAYVVFRVTTVTNNGAKPADFPFDPQRLYVDQTDPAAFVNSSIRISSLNPFALVGRTVKAGESQTFNGAAIAVVSTQDVDGAKEASATKYGLRYSALDKPGALTKDIAPDRTHWSYTPNCLTITF